MKLIDLPLINCEAELNLSWKKGCVLTDYDSNLKNATFSMNSTNLSIRTVHWNKYRS